MLWGGVVLLAACGTGERGGIDAAATYGEPMREPVRMTMAALHAAGGVPPGWQLTPAAGDVERGRRVFAEQGCASCHRVDGESFPDAIDDESRGPDLTGMGAHHPPAYFVEAILSPSAILVEGPGWVSEGGRSTMPAYPHMTVAELTDVVAYLSSLTTGGTHDHEAMMAAVAAMRASQLAPRPAPPPSAARSFFVMRYDVLPGRLEDFERWFAAEGRAAFLSYDGVVSVDTWVDGGKPGVVTVIAFRDDQALTAFLNDPSAETLGLAFDEFVGPHGHLTHRVPPVYRAPTLSAEAAKPPTLTSAAPSGR
jgi:mono/diheme cytochrome c family protein